MSAPRPLQEQCLASTQAILESFTKRFAGREFEARLQALEAASSRIGGFNLAEFHRAFKTQPICPTPELAKIGAQIVAGIETSRIPPSFALSAFAREPLAESKRRNTGAYHTDFRLALHLAKVGTANLRARASVMDPACGTGMLLAAVTHVVCGSDRRKANEWLRDSVNAADLSPASLRGTLLALASFTSDVGVLERMRSRWLCQDSLIADLTTWRTIAPAGFDLVIGNPPWEKVKTTRHEFLKATGLLRHYGADYERFDAASYQREQNGTSAYASMLSDRYACAQGEIDLYVAFLELFLQLTRDGGRIAAFVPAGLIRSQRTEALRRLVLASSSRISITVLENRARFFRIDTRFKFIALSCEKASKATGRRDPIVVAHAYGTPTEVVERSRTVIGRKALETIRPDLTVPEVRGSREWALFLKMSRNGMTWSDPADSWTPEIVRELDMTRDRASFTSLLGTSLIPVIEGRMVQQHRFGAKAYVGGTGRSSIWRPLPLGSSDIVPQFRVDRRQLGAKVRARIDELRVGFCDITGQTNERSLMAALIPRNVICGNKVPTITFPADPSEERLLLWVGIANSLPFDWMLRRVVTTTVNYFVLLGIPLPRITKESLPGRKIIEATRRLSEIDGSLMRARNGLEIADLRASIDVAVARAYGMDYDEIDLMLQDFPLLDRGQPPLPGERRSTVTKDYVRLIAGKRMRERMRINQVRVEHAIALGAVPYIPAEHVENLGEAEVDNG